MPYQIKLNLISQPAKKLGPAERQSLADGLVDAGEFMYQTVWLNTPVKSGNLRNSTRKLVFANKGSAKVYYDMSQAPYAAEVMRGNKTERVISAHGKALKFVYHGQTMFVKSVVRRPTKGNRLMQRLYASAQFAERLREILVAHLKTDLSAQKQAPNISAMQLTSGDQ